MDTTAVANTPPNAIGPMTTMLTISGYGVCLFLGLFCATILVMIWQGKIDLRNILSETNGQASMSRLQLLIFTLVIAISLFALVERSTTYAFPAIPDGVLTLLGISASTYAVGKGISYSRPEGVTTRSERSDTLQTVEDVSATGAAVVVKPNEVAAGGASLPVSPPAQD